MFSCVTAPLTSRSWLSPSHYLFPDRGAQILGISKIVSIWSDKCLCGSCNWSSIAIFIYQRVWSVASLCTTIEFFLQSASHRLIIVHGRTFRNDRRIGISSCCLCLTQIRPVVAFYCSASMILRYVVRISLIFRIQVNNPLLIGVSPCGSMWSARRWWNRRRA